MGEKGLQGTAYRKQVAETCVFMPGLRARLCMYTVMGIYYKIQSCKWLGHISTYRAHDCGNKVEAEWPVEAKARSWAPWLPAKGSLSLSPLLPWLHMEPLEKGRLKV